MAVKDNPILFLYRRMWQYSDKKKVSIFTFMFLLANTINFFEPLVVGWILNIVQESGITAETMPKLIWITSLFIAMQLGFWLFHGPARVIERKNAFDVRANYKKYLLEGTMDLPASWHAEHHSGDSIDKIEKATRSLYEFSEDTFEIIETVLRLIGSYFALTYFNISASYIVAIIVFITIFLILQFDKVLIVQYRELFKAENRISAKIFDVISNITTVIILRIEKLVSSSIMQKIMAPFKLFLKNTKLNEVKWFIVSVMTAIMIFLVMTTYIVSSVRAGDIVLVGTIYALYGYVQRINGTFYRFAYKYGQIVMQKTAVQNADEIEQEFSTKRMEKRSVLSKNWKEIKLESLDFSYHNDEEDLHLEDINLRWKRGERVALVGESGSGKTTLLKVMRQLYEPQKLKLSVDGKMLTNGFSDISSDVALIPQDPEIFNTTIKENITMGVEHSLAYIRKYTDMASFTDVVMKLPKKWDSSIKEKGVNLSGGEKQRLALARGLLASVDKQMVFLDEPTSSVDAKNEHKVFENIFRSFKDKAILASVHRLHLLDLFDRVYYFKNGRIIASGTLTEVLRNREFKTAWDKYHKGKDY